MFVITITKTTDIATEFFPFSSSMELEKSVRWIPTNCYFCTSSNKKRLKQRLGKQSFYTSILGFTDETLVASGTPPNLDIPPSSCLLESSSFYQRYLNGFCLLREYLVQSGIYWTAKLFSQRYRLLDYPITKQFLEDYELKKKHEGNFPDVNKVVLFCTGEECPDKEGCSLFLISNPNWKSLFFILFR